MDWKSILYSPIPIGIVIDLFAAILMIRDCLGFSFKNESPATRGMPFGIIFYLLGFLQLIFINKKPLSFALMVLFCCILFYALVVFSEVIVGIGILSIRRLRASCKKVFYSDFVNGISVKKTIENALEYLIDGINKSSTTGKSHSCESDHCDKSKPLGFIYIKCLAHVFRVAEIKVLASGISLVYVGEDDPGLIRKGHFARRMADHGFSIEKWEFDKRKRLIFPLQDYAQIPQFIDTYFGRYCNYGGGYNIKVEVLKMYQSIPMNA